MTIVALAAMGDDDQLEFYLHRGIESGLTRDQIVEAVTHLGFYAGWGKATRAMTAVKWGSNSKWGMKKTITNPPSQLLDFNQYRNKPEHAKATIPQEIPAGVWAAYERLVSTGYDKRVIGNA